MYPVFSALFGYPRKSGVKEQKLGVQLDDFRPRIPRIFGAVMWPFQRAPRAAVNCDQGTRTCLGRRGSTMWTGGSYDARYWNPMGTWNSPWKPWLPGKVPAVFHVTVTSSVESLIHKEPLGFLCRSAAWAVHLSRELSNMVKPSTIPHWQHFYHCGGNQDKLRPCTTKELVNGSAAFHGRIPVQKWIQPPTTTIDPFWTPGCRRIHVAWPSFFSIKPADSQPISWWPRTKKWPSILSAVSHHSVSTKIGTSACQPQVSPLNRKTNWNDVPDWKNPIHSFSVFFGFQLIHAYIYIIKYIYLFIPSAPFGHQQKPVQPLSAWRSEECSDLRSSQRGLPFALSPMRTTSNSHSPVREQVSKEGNQIGKIGIHHVTSIPVCSRTAPYYIPGILCWEILWVCNSPWAIGHVSRQVKNWRSSLQPLEMFPLSLKQYTSNTLFNTPTRDLAVALAGICIEVCDV